MVRRHDFNKDSLFSDRESRATLGHGAVSLRVWWEPCGARSAVGSRTPGCRDAGSAAFFWRGVVELRDPNPGPMVVSDRMS